jgi:flagellar protein FliL
MSAVMADPAAAEAPARRPRKKLILIGGVALVLVLALGAVTVVFLKQRAAHAAAVAAGDEDAAPDRTASAHIDPKNIPIYLPLDPFIVNLADKDADRYAQIGITLELDSGTSADEIKAYMPAIRNAILLILANKSSKELLSREGKEQLAQDIMREAVRPMGIEIAAPELVSPAPIAASGAASAAASGAASGVLAVAAKPKPRRHDARNPIQHVHFSSFIIQ